MDIAGLQAKRVVWICRWIGASSLLDTIRSSKSCSFTFSSPKANLVTAFDSGDAAIAEAAESAQPVVLFFGGTGPFFAVRARHEVELAQVPTILATGAEPVPWFKGVDVLRKPYTFDQLLRVLERAAEQMPPRVPPIALRPQRAPRKIDPLQRAHRKAHRRRERRAAGCRDALGWSAGAPRPQGCS